MINPISFASVIPVVIIMTLLFFVAWVVVRFVPFFRRTVESEEHGRYESLDGLRGLLAFGVFFQHAATNYTYITTGIWKITDYSIYRHLGGEAVILFFMITSFLYWSKAIAEKGEINVAKLYRSRFYRLAPMYLFSAGIITVIALFSTGFQISSFTGFVKDILSWLTLGLQTTLSVNGFNILPVNAGIHWTLHFEWFFYLLLPIGAIALKSKEMRYIVLPIAILAFLHLQWGYWVIFLFGIASAHIVRNYRTMPWVREWWAGFIPLVGFLLVYQVQYEPYSMLQYFITTLIFLIFVYGNDLFGILKKRATKLLGTISYSIYLIHGIILYLVLHTVNIFYPIITMSSFVFWTTITVSGVLTILASLLTYRYIEYPFLNRIHPKKLETTDLDIAEKVI